MYEGSNITIDEGHLKLTRRTESYSQLFGVATDQYAHDNSDGLAAESLYFDHYDALQKPHIGSAVTSHFILG